jgi:hypothetical protein
MLRRDARCRPRHAADAAATAYARDVDVLRRQASRAARFERHGARFIAAAHAALAAAALAQFHYCLSLPRRRLRAMLTMPRRAQLC